MTELLLRISNLEHEAARLAIDAAMGYRTYKNIEHQLLEYGIAIEQLKLRLDTAEFYASLDNPTSEPLKSQAEEENN